MSNGKKKLLGMASFFMAMMAESEGHIMDHEKKVPWPEPPKREPEKLPEPIPHFANPKKLSKRERKKLKGKKK